MKRNCAQVRRSSPQQGQAFIAIVIFIAMFLLAVLGLATDYTQVWAHRQMAQGAADAACQAAAADLFLFGTDPSATTDFSTFDFSWISAGSTFNCTAKPNSPPCLYASFNGYTGSAVSVSFPTTVPGAGTIPAGISIAHPYVKVTITDPVAMLFTKIVSSTKTVNVTASAACGLNPINTPVPLVILHRTASPSIQVNGSATVTILGGPQRSIQVDSSSATAVSAGTVDLHLAGPSGTGSDFALFGGPTAKPTNVNVGTTGHWIPRANPFGDPFASVSAPDKPATSGTATPVPFGFNGCPDPVGCVEFTPGDYTGCSTGSFAAGGKGCLNLPYAGSNPSFTLGGTNWQPSHTYAKGALIKPSTPTCLSTANPGNFVYVATTTGTSAGACPALFNQAPCTRQADGTCSLGTTTDVGVIWQNVGVDSTGPSTAIFDPGLYYLDANGLSLGTGSSTARVSTATGDGSGGVMFYFSASGSLKIGSTSGGATACTSVPYPYNSGSPSGCLVAYQIDGTLSPAATGYVGSTPLKCPSGSANPPQVVAAPPPPGSILLGPCGGTSGIGATGKWGSPDGNRGFLFFQNRSIASDGGACTGGFGGKCAILGGGGSFIFSGFIYFHKGNGGTCGTDTSCLTFAGGSGGNSFTIGDIVVDKLSMVGGSAVNMVLNPLATFSTLRPTLIQ